MYELYGMTKYDTHIERLGIFHTRDFALKAFDNFWGIGYKNLSIHKIIE